MRVDTLAPSMDNVARKNQRRDMIEKKTKGEPLPFTDVELEKSLLGHILDTAQMETEVLEVLTEDDFSNPANRRIFKTAVELYSVGRSPGLTQIADFLSKTGELSKTGGITYLHDIRNSKLPGSTAVHAADMLRTQGIRRRLSEYGAMLSGLAAGGVPVETLLEDGERLFRDVSMKAFTDTTDTVGNVFDTVMEQARKKAGSGELTGITSGFVEFDEMVGGFRNSDLLILAGRPAMGKTAFALCLLLNIALHGVPAAIFSLEMSREQLTERLIAMMSRVSLGRIRKARLSEYDLRDMERCREIFKKMPITIDDNGMLTTLDLRAKARRMKAEKGIRMIVVDYLQLMSCPSAAKHGRTAEVGEISKTLKQVAKELDLPVLALSQLNRKVEDRDDKHPNMSDLRESGSIEQDADIIMFVYRDEVYNKSRENPNRDVAEIIVAKHRGGDNGIIRLAWVKHYTMFANAMINAENL